MKCLPKLIDLSQIAAENVELFAPQAEQKQILLSNVIPKNTTAYADPSMVDTVIRNLLSNALKFTAPGGNVAVSTAEHAEHFLAVSVMDTGMGIAEEMLPKLFRIDTHYKNVGTAGEQGTGLGLILCKELVETNGGNLWVESEVGKGTTFTFTLPKQPVE